MTSALNPRHKLFTEAFFGAGSCDLFGFQYLYIKLLFFFFFFLVHPYPYSKTCTLHKLFWFTTWLGSWYFSYDVKTKLQLGCWWPLSEMQIFSLNCQGSTKWLITLSGCQTVLLLRDLKQGHPKPPKWELLVPRDLYLPHGWSFEFWCQKP